MINWKYTIYGEGCRIVTGNIDFAEQKSKQGYIIFCKRESNVFKFNH